MGMSRYSLAIWLGTKASNVVSIIINAWLSALKVIADLAKIALKILQQLQVLLRG